jgi:hypothetical protein
MTIESTDAAAMGSLSRLARARGVIARSAKTWGRVATRVLRDPVVLREAAPLVLPLVLAPWLAVCLDHYAHGVVWRDTTMMTYASWCMLHGDRIYDSVALMDGPMAFLTNAILLLVGGLDMASWRQADLVFHTIVGGALGMLLAPSAPRLHAMRRIVWAFVGAASWLTAILAFDFPATVQREAHYAGMGLLGVVLIYASAGRSRRVAAGMLLGGAMLAGLTPWGKQTAAIYVALALVAAWMLPPSEGQSRRWRLRWVGTGVLASALAVVVFVAAVGSLRGLWFWFFEYNLVYYRFHDNELLTDILKATWARDAQTNAALVLVSGVAALAVRALPARAAVFVVAPALELVSVLLQHKGWRYYYIPTNVCTAVFFLYALSRAWGLEVKEESHRLAQGVAVVLLSTFVGFTSIQTILGSPWLQESEGHGGDASVTDMLAASILLGDHTKHDDRVFQFGDEPGVLLFAERHPATPYIVPWMVDLSLHVPDGEHRPKGEPWSRIRSLESRNQNDMCARLVSDPPPALVFKDGSAGYEGLISDAFYRICPAFQPIGATRYHELKSGPFHIVLRNDRP